MRTFRSITVEGDEFEFSGGFTELHTRSYKHILDGSGFRISEAEKAIKTVHNIRQTKPIGLKGDYHPLAKLPLAKHPFNIK
jgi:UDP-N-acetyl-2-amino-2-deoxyglucuronate dehydrogenase